MIRKKSFPKTLSELDEYILKLEKDMLSFKKYVKCLLYKTATAPFPKINRFAPLNSLFRKIKLNSGDCIEYFGLGIAVFNPLYTCSLCNTHDPRLVHFVGPFYSNLDEHWVHELCMIFSMEDYFHLPIEPYALDAFYHEFVSLMLSNRPPSLCKICSGFFPVISCTECDNKFHTTCFLKEDGNKASYWCNPRCKSHQNLMEEPEQVIRVLPQTLTALGIKELKFLSDQHPVSSSILNIIAVYFFSLNFIKKCS